MDPEPTDDFRIKALHAGGTIVFRQHTVHRFTKGGSVGSRFQLDNQRLFTGKDGQHIGKERNAFIRAEKTELMNLIQRQVADTTVQTGAAGQVIIMENNNMAIPGELYIQLCSITCFHCTAESRQRVFRYGLVGTVKAAMSEGPSRKRGACGSRRTAGEDEEKP
jgi:hypothetical protein